MGAVRNSVLLFHALSIWRKVSRYEMFSSLPGAAAAGDVTTPWYDVLFEGFGIRLHPTQRIDEPHLIDRLTRDFQQLRAGDEHRECPRT